MRLWVLALTITCVAAVVPPSAPAETRLDPVAALRVQLASGTGVTATRVTIFTEPGEKPNTYRDSGVHRLANGEVVASETLNRTDGTYWIRRIDFKDRYYEQHRDQYRYLPAGKSWSIIEVKQSLALTCGHLRLSHPATLKALLSGATGKRPAGVHDGTRTTLYEGVITLGELTEVDPDVRIGRNRPTGAYLQVRINWQLWTGQDQLIRRCHSSSWQPGLLGEGEDTFDPVQEVVDVRLSRWGHAADIRPPAADQVATLDELTFPDKDPADSP